MWFTWQSIFGLFDTCSLSVDSLSDDPSFKSSVPQQQPILRCVDAESGGSQPLEVGFKFKLRAFRFKLRHGFCFRARGRSVPWGSNFDDEVTHMVRMRSSCYGSWRSSPRLRSFGARVTWCAVGTFPLWPGRPCASSARSVLRSARGMRPRPSSPRTGQSKCGEAVGFRCVRMCIPKIGAMKIEGIAPVTLRYSGH